VSDFKAKMHQIVCRLGLCPRLRWGSAPDSAGGDYSTPQIPVWILGAYF